MFNLNLLYEGEKVGDDEYIYNSHYRRFLKIEDLVDDLKRGGFNIIFANESDSYAVYKDERPYVIRIIAQKNNNKEKINPNKVSA